MIELVWVVFGVGLVAGITNSVGILASVLGVSDYYPPGERNWRYYCLWGLSHVVNLSLLGVGILQWRTLELPWIVTTVGFLVLVSGFAIAIAAGLDLGVEETQGIRGELRTGGWYRYSRNPQYVGYVVATIAYPIVTRAPLVIPLVAIYLGWWFLFPFAEEPWLREEYGEAYERYVDRVPRFVGRHTARALCGRTERSRSAERT